MNYIPELSSIDLRRSPIDSNSRPPIGSLIAMLRSPRAHVYSQFLECKYDHWGRKQTQNTSFPRGNEAIAAAGFSEWLQYFLDEKTQDFNCYHPVNMQTRYFAADRSDVNFNAHHVKSERARRPNLEQAKWRLKHMFFVGLVEHFKESMCVLEFLATHELPARCTCEQLRSYPHRHKITHNVPQHDYRRDILDADVRRIDELTSLDKELYRYGVCHFVSLNKLVHRYTARWVVCPAKIRKLRENNQCNPVPESSMHEKSKNYELKI